MGSSNPANLTVFNNKLYFSADDGVSVTALWEYDGSNMTLITNTTYKYGNSNPSYLTVFNGKLYFSYYDGYAIGNELWVLSR